MTQIQSLKNVNDHQILTPSPLDAAPYAPQYAPDTDRYKRGVVV